MYLNDEDIHLYGWQKKHRKKLNIFDKTCFGLIFPQKKVTKNYYRAAVGRNIQTNVVSSDIIAVMGK